MVSLVSSTDRWFRGTKARVLFDGDKFVPRGETISNNKYRINLNYKETEIIKREHPLNATSCIHT